MKANKRSRLGAALALALVGSLGLMGCSGSGGGSGSNAGAPADKDTVTMAFRTPNWVLPISQPGYTQGENATFSTSMYRPLYSYDLDSDTKYNIMLDKSLGEVPEISEDGKTLTIKLRQDAKWSDGKPITTRDLEFWWNLINANKEKWASYREGQFPDNVTKFEIKDEHTFALTTDKQYSPGWFVDNQLTKVSVIPQHAWDKASADEEVSDLDRDPAGAVKVFDFLVSQSKDLATYETNPLWKVTSGPWQIGKYVPDGQVTMVPSENYWGKDKPAFKKLVLKPFTGDDAEFNVLRAGKIDYGYIPATNMSQKAYMEGKGYKVVPWAGWSITYMPFNFANPTSGPIFKQKYIRQAMQMLIDQKTISEKIWMGIANPTCGPVPMEQDKVGTLEGCAYKFDPDGAKKLLEEHGWKVSADTAATCEDPAKCGEGVPAGAKLEFKLISQSGFDATTKMMSELKSQMSKVGIILDIQEVPDSVSVSQQCEEGQPCNWDLSFFGSQGSWYYPVYASGERLFQSKAPVNLGLYSDAKADELITATQFSDSPDAMKEYNEYLAEDLPVLWMPNPVYQVSAFRTSLQGVEPLDLMNAMFPEDWSWK